MATQLQLRRGTTVENDGFTGALAEVTVDTDTHELRVHDGSTQGGFVIPTESDMNAALGDKADVSDVYDKATVDTALNAKAETDLGNITDGAKNVASWSSNVTNCITEIPQDIKLELNAGTLTLKAGSKVYVPNGFEQDGVTPKFDERLIELDTIRTFSSNNVMYFVKPDKTLDSLIITYCYSGSTAPTVFQDGLYAVWYDITNNIVKRTGDAGSTWTTGYSLPVFIGNSDNTSQVFNGFGYIGSIVFALPGIKGLIPNGRNTDGTLNNTVTNDYNTVKTVQVNASTAKIAMYVGGGLGSQTNGFELNEQENFNYDSGVLTNALEVVRVIVDSSAKIIAFAPKTVFHALDYNDTEYMAHQAMPSARYINLTVGASGTRYDAPADGWFVASSDGVVTIGLMGNRSGITVNGAAGFAPWATLPVSKGSYVLFTYSSNQNNKLRFYYAEGSK